MLSRNHTLGPHERVQTRASNVALRMVNTEDASCITCEAVVEITNTRLLVRVAGCEPGKYRVHQMGDRSFWGLELPLVPSLALGAIAGAKLVQPWFGPQRWEAHILPARNSELEPSSEWHLSLSFLSGGATEFSTVFSETALAAATAKREQIDETLPPYVR